MRPKSSLIWRFFNQVNADSAKCKQCDKTFSRKGGGTTSLKLHLKSKHGDKYEELLLLEKDIQQIPHTTKQLTPLQECKKQLSITDSLKNKGAWDESNVKQKEIDKLVAEMIALQNLSFNFVEGVGFQRLMQAALPRYHLRGRQYFTNLLCTDIYNKIKLKVLGLLKQFEKLSFTTDVWSEPSSNVSLLSLTAHGITNKYERVSIILKCEQLEGRHTGEIIANNLNNILKDWGLSTESVHCILRDRGSNMIKAMNMANFTDANCTIHQLQLCVRSTMEIEEFLSSVITKCKKIATHFNHSLIAQNELKQIQTERLNQSGLSIIQECSTRWNATYYMMKRILTLKDSLVLYSGAHDIPILNADEWLDLKKCVAILKPFEEITKELSSATATIASVIPLIYTLKNTLETEKSKEETSENFKLMITKMIQDINVRFQDIENNKIYTIATYLDPRFKLKFFTEITKEQVQSEILGILGCSKASRDEGPSSPKRSRNEIPTTSSSNYSHIQSCLAEILSLSDEEEQNIDCGDDVHNQFIVKKTLLNEYNREKRLTLNEDPLLWWKMHTKYHCLSDLVRQYLSPPPGSVPSEQLFSAAGLIYDPLRNRLSGDKAAKLLFVKYNLPLLSFDY
ncbi:unnamed protein product [Parnassius mnemosyne]|uniref:BED-type domain-containing protein n=1 Tax=Parnassius mnemosyne TaxID=213953 RepID=A0AAV1KU64_9NEOP